MLTATENVQENVQGGSLPVTMARSFFGSSIGQKIVMAVTGAILSLFVLGHMTGNLQAFLPNGPAALDHYGALLRELLHGAGLWVVRLVMLVSVGLHIWAYLSLTRKSLGARPRGYQVTSYQEANWASRTMRWTGPLLAIFIVYHILHFTTGTVHPHFVEGHVYDNLIAGLQVTPVAFFYLVAMGALAFHLYHGAWSMLQTLGLSHPRFDPIRKKLAVAFTIVVAGGFAVVPLAVLTGMLR
jgi:succinate dehydrogenase / fumarate reductase cytochrome b subunit